jgi:hypothetical protein
MADKDRTMVSDEFRLILRADPAGCAKPANTDARKSQFPQQLDEFLMSAAKRHYRRMVTVASTEHGTRCITARRIRARSLLWFWRRNPSSSAVAEVWQEEVTWNRRSPEPSLEELFRDVTMQLLMRRDGVTESDVRALLGQLRNAREAASGGTAWECDDSVFANRRPIEGRTWSVTDCKNYQTQGCSRSDSYDVGCV